MASCAVEDSVQTLLYVVINDEFRGYKPDLLLEVLSKIENQILSCPFCQGITREAVVSEGQTICSACNVNKIVTQNHQSSSPKDVSVNYSTGTYASYSYSMPDSTEPSIIAAPSIAPVTENKDVRELVCKLAVRCPLSVRGCGWRGQVGDLEAHVSGCEHLMVACGLRCGSVIIQREISQHQGNLCEKRFVYCEYCKGRFLAEELESHVLDDCLSVAIVCPQNCGQKSVRSQMRDHIDEVCELSRVICPFKSCEKVSLVRKELKGHQEESVIDHQQCLYREVEGQNHKSDKLNEEVEMLRKKISQQDAVINNQNTQVAQLQISIWNQSNEHRSEIERSNTKISQSESKQSQLNKRIDQLNSQINLQSRENLRLENLIEKMNGKLTAMETYVKRIPSMTPEMLLCRCIRNGQRLNVSDLRPIDKFEWVITGVSKKYGTRSYLEGPTFSFSKYRLQCQCHFGVGFLNIYLKRDPDGTDELTLPSLNLNYYCIRIVNRMDEARSVVDMGVKECLLKTKYQFFARLSPLLFPEFVQRNSIIIRIQLIRNIHSLTF